MHKYAFACGLFLIIYINDDHRLLPPLVLNEWPVYYSLYALSSRTYHSSFIKRTHTNDFYALLSFVAFNLLSAQPQYVSSCPLHIAIYRHIATQTIIQRLYSQVYSIFQLTSFYLAYRPVRNTGHHRR